MRLRLIYIIAVLICLAKPAFSQDKNFYIFICFGQSNMEGNAKIQVQDTIVDSRIQVLETVDCPDLKRKKGNWYTAVPPLARCNTGLTPAEGKCAAMNNIIASLPAVIRNSFIISSKGCPCTPDKLHFTAEGYRILGRRYGKKMLDILGYPVKPVN